ncbi:MAG: ion transporter [Candidatus Eisenbacteria bacterium]
MEGLRHRIHEIIFEADTTAGKLFDLVLIFSILVSVLAVLLDSVAWIRADHGTTLYAIEWFFTILFTIEYLLRVYSVERPSAYVRSFFGVIDLLAILPTYLSVVLPGTQYLLVIRVLRVLRVFRVLKLAAYVGATQDLMEAIGAARSKITVFFFFVITLVTVLGSLMYLVEGAGSGFTSIPKAIYWSIVTLTTVGYGDISPQTTLGQFLAAVVMVLGYAIIAVPTGIVTAELASVRNRTVTTQTCRHCNREDHDADAVFCKHCGARLNP